MSTARIEALLKESQADIILVPRMTMKGKQDILLSKKLRQFDNIKIGVNNNSSGISINTNESYSRDLISIP